MDGLADAYIQFLYLLTGQNLFVLPQFFVEKAQFGAVVDDVRNLFLITMKWNTPQPSIPNLFFSLFTFGS